MADQDRELLDEVLAGAQAMGGLAEDEEAFRGAVDAFRAQDGESMHKLLERHGLAERCELVCHWLRSKEAVLLCLELAGPPRLEDAEAAPDGREFAEIVAKLTADEAAVELMANAVQDRNTSAWSELISKYGLERHSHLLCHWVCTVHYRLVCEVVCRPFHVQRPNLVGELRAAGLVLGGLAADREVFAAADEAVRANRCETLSTILEGGGFAPHCFVICEWFCSRRCMLVCLRLCRIFPLERLESPIGEMLEFARAGGRLAADKSNLERLTAALLREDADQVQTLAKELQFERFCVQFCHWVCFLRCRRFCFCVCPPRTIGVFTRIGALYYDSQVDSHVGGGGLTLATPARAFYSNLRLNGGLSLVDGAPLIEYRFQTIETSDTGNPTGAWQPVTPGQIAETNIGSFIRFVPGPAVIETIPVYVNKEPATPGFNISPDGDGWIKVPPMFPGVPFVTGSGWRFVPSSDLAVLITPTLAPTVVAIDETGVNAGASGNPPLLTDAHYGIGMWIRDQTTTGAGSNAGTCHHIAINNSHYDNVSHHPYWPGGLFGANHELLLASLGIAELATTPCSLLTDTLTVEYTAAHSHLGDVVIRLEGPGGPYHFDLVPAATGQTPGENEFGTAVPAAAQPWTFGDLPPCAYWLTLSVDALLTTGDAIPSAVVDYIAFCKGRPPQQ
jgi:hypothetical protein